MNSKYKVIKFKKNKFEKIDDLISIEEPLEISIKYKKQNEWVTSSLSITMRTPGHDEDLVRGFLFNEQIIENLEDIKSIESLYKIVSQYNSLFIIYRSRTTVVMISVELMPTVLYWFNSFFDSVFVAWLCFIVNHSVSISFIKIIVACNV